MSTPRARMFKAAALGSAALVALSGCSFSPYSIPFPGGADLGSHPYTVTVNFRDVLDLVPQSAVRVDDVAVGKVTDIKLHGWTAVVKVKINDKAKLPDNAVASIRQTSLLGEKFVSLAAPATGAVGRLGDGDVIPLDRSGRNPEIEEVLGAASLLFNGGGLEKTRTVVQELNNTLDGNEPQIRELLSSANTFVSQLDTNKAKILTALEKVNNLALATNKQKDAITGALDSLPGALDVVNQQRGDLVKLLEALNNLGAVGTRVVKESKADTLADLKALGPVLTQLADSGDDLAKSLTALLTFPFPDGSVNGAAGGGKTAVENAKAFAQGDYFNLSVRADLSLCQLGAITSAVDLGLDKVIGLITGDKDCVKPDGGNATSAGGATQTPLVADPAASLSALAQSLVPQTRGLPDLGALLPGPTSTPAPGAATPSSQPPAGSTGGLQLPGLCNLLGSCRTAPANTTPAESTDLARLLMEPVVAR